MISSSLALVLHLMRSRPRLRLFLTPPSTPFLVLNMVPSSLGPTTYNSQQQQDILQSHERNYLFSRTPSRAVFSWILVKAQAHASSQQPQPMMLSVSGRISFGASPTNSDYQRVPMADWALSAVSFSNDNLKYASIASTKLPEGVCWRL